MISNWIITEDNWNSNFMWFLVDDGQIQYSFKTLFEANVFIHQHNLSFMLLTDIDNIVNDTMLDVNEYRAWNNKIQRCVFLS